MPCGVGGRPPPPKNRSHTMSFLPRSIDQSVTMPVHIQKLGEIDPTCFLISGTVMSLLWTECLCSPRQFIRLNLMPSVMVFGGEAFGRCLGPEGGDLMNGISFLIKETQRAPSPCEDTRRSWPVMNQEASSHQTPILLTP